MLFTLSVSVFANTGNYIGVTSPLYPSLLFVQLQEGKNVFLSFAFAQPLVK